MRSHTIHSNLIFDSSLSKLVSIQLRDLVQWHTILTSKGMCKPHFATDMQRGTLSPSFSGCISYFGCHTLKALVILKAPLHRHTWLTQDQLVMIASQMTSILGLH